jgi:hypothetical protein
MMLKLVELGWGRENPAFRQVYTTMFIPESTPEQFRWFTDLLARERGGIDPGI